MADLEARYGRARRCPTGSAVISAAGNLPATWVVHAVGPVWHGGAAGEAVLLASAYRSAFALADDAGARSVTFPAISTGVYRYPVEEAAAIAVTAVADALASAVSVRLATFVLFSEPSFAAFEAALRRDRLDSQLTAVRCRGAPTRCHLRDSKTRRSFAARNRGLT
jgi:O-acetyl-ADP-ribose deacetylase (regulator of RNase III)